jgi:hypothetical protein
MSKYSKFDFGLKGPVPATYNPPKGWGGQNSGRGSVDLTPIPRRPVSGYRDRRAALFFSAPDYPEINFEVMSPSWAIDVDFPLEDMLGLSYSETLLKGVGTEASEAAAVTLAPAAGQSARVIALEVTAQQSTFQTPQGSMRATVTYTPERSVAFNVNDTFNGTDGIAVTTIPTVTQYADFSMPADGRQRRFYVILGQYSTGLAKTLPTPAILRTATAGSGNEVAPATILTNFTNLGDGSGIQFVVQACTPGTLPYERLLALIPSVFGDANA